MDEYSEGRIVGAGQSDLYKGTYGDNPDNIPDELKDRVKMPESDSKLKHIFRKAEGHLPDTVENRKMLKDLANDRQSHLGKAPNEKEYNEALELLKEV